MGKRAVQVPGVISARKGNLNHSRIEHGEETWIQVSSPCFFRGRIVFFMFQCSTISGKFFRILTKYGLFQ